MNVLGFSFNIYVVNNWRSVRCFSSQTQHPCCSGKLINFHGLKSGELEHLLYFHLSFYKAFTSDHLCLMPGFSFKWPRVVCSE